MRILRFTLVLVLSACGIAFYGCSKPGAPAGGVAEAEHDHEELGPHDGHIIELGSEDYHAELTHDEETHKVGVYLLGSDAKTAAPIVAESVVINVSEDGAPKQFTLPAVPQPGEADGKSSYFEIVDESLCKIVCGESEAKSTQARLSLKIDDKPYVGMIETAPHDHDHDHGHEH